MLLGVILLIIGNYVSPVRAYLEKSTAIQHEQALTDDLRFQRDQLQQEKDSLQNNNYVEQVARKDLGMIKPGEQPYVVKDLNSFEDQKVDPAQESVDVSLTDRIMNAVGSLLP